MYDRRAVLAASGVFLSGVAGCLSGDDSGSGTGTTTPSTSEGTTSPPTSEGTTTSRSTDESTADTDDETVPGWEYQWIQGWNYDNALGVDPFEGTLYVTLSDDGSGDNSSATAAVDPADGTVLWQTEHEGEAVEYSYVRHNEGDDQWGVTLTEESVYSVNGNADRHEWTTLHAMARDTGERRWTLERDQLLGVVGVFQGTVFVQSTEFFVPEHSEDQPDPRPTSVLAVDADSGEVRWEKTVTAADSMVGVDDEGVYFVADDRLLAFGHDGKKQGDRELPSGNTTLAVASGGRYLLQRSEAGNRIAGFAPDGSERWSHEAGGYHSLAVDDVLYIDRPSLSAVGAGGTIRWQADAYGGDFVTSPSGETLYSSSGMAADAVTAYANADGHAKWTIDPPYQNAWPAAATADTVVVEAFGDQGYRLYAVDAASGDLRAHLRGAQSFAIEGVGDRVVVATGTGSIQSLPARP
ncbi:PQQ-binding-like beta-propeller repeat protein [Haloarchaeobius sp. DFWS5]|uniref:outer membrane protein assembly factor BamB family protein n=1 Tax=Haloarchaeobius sp. DFWS5 TaxID=3446114 RepID=UPI003EBCB574